jgi:acetyl-CoA carboxylase carboxyltransferase component
MQAPNGAIDAVVRDEQEAARVAKELEAIADPAERRALFDKLVGEYYEKGKAISMASFLEIDSVIDPMETRRWVMRGVRSAPPAPARSGKKRPNIDTW